MIFIRIQWYIWFPASCICPGVWCTEALSPNVFHQPPVWAPTCISPPNRTPIYRCSTSEGRGDKYRHVIAFARSLSPPCQCSSQFWYGSRDQHGVPSAMHEGNRQLQCWIQEFMDRPLIVEMNTHGLRTDIQPWFPGSTILVGKGPAPKGTRRQPLWNAYGLQCHCSENVLHRSFKP